MQLAEFIVKAKKVKESTILCPQLILNILTLPAIFLS